MFYDGRPKETTRTTNRKKDQIQKSAASADVCVMCILNSVLCILGNIWAFVLLNPELIPTTIGVWIAYQALTTWKKEHIGKKKLDLAAEVIASFKLMEELIRKIRSDVIRSWEQELIATEFNIDSQHERLILYFAPHARIHQNEKEIATWYELRYKSSVYWPGIEHKFFELNQIINRISNVSKSTFNFAVESQEKGAYLSELKTGEFTTEIDSYGGIRFINNVPEENKDEINRVLDSIMELNDLISKNIKTLFNTTEHDDELSQQINEIIIEVEHKNNVGKDIKPNSWYKIKDKTDV